MPAARDIPAQACPLNCMVAEFGLPSFETLGTQALDHLGETTTRR